MKNTCISIVVPVHKVPYEYLKKCIESLVEQTYTDLEIILVDDGSPDQCGAICDSYAEKDSRICVIHQENMGLCGARNTGIKAASGEWIILVDGDDQLEIQTCETIYAYTQTNTPDIVLFGMIKDHLSTKKPLYFPYEDGQLFVGADREKVQIDALHYTTRISSACAKLFRRSFLIENELFFDEALRQGIEGLEFLIRALGKASSIIAAKKHLYHYSSNETSISSQFDESKLHFLTNGLEQIREYIEQNPSCSLMMDMFQNRVLYVIATTTVSGYLHPKSQEGYFIKRRKLKGFLSTPVYAYALQHAALMDMPASRKALIMLLKKRLYLAAQIVAYIRYHQRKFS